MVYWEWNTTKEPLWTESGKHDKNLSKTTKGDAYGYKIY